MLGDVFICHTWKLKGMLPVPEEKFRILFNILQYTRLYSPN